MALTDGDLEQLRRCVGDRLTLFEDRNRITGGDPTAHLEFAIARGRIVYATSSAQLREAQFRP